MSTEHFRNGTKACVCSSNISKWRVKKTNSIEAPLSWETHAFAKRGICPDTGAPNTLLCTNIVVVVVVVVDYYYQTKPNPNPKPDSNPNPKLTSSGASYLFTNASF